MNTINDYIDAAKFHAKLPSDNSVARALGLTHASVNGWRQKRTWPADETMLKLAELAGRDPNTALLDLNVWRSKSQVARNQYLVLLQRIAIVAFIGILAYPTLSSANYCSPYEICIMRQMAVWAILLGFTRGFNILWLNRI